MDDPTEYHDENALVKLTSLAVLGVGLAALFLGYSEFWLVFALGFAVLVPMVKVVTSEFGVDVGDDEPTDRSERPAETDPERAESTQDALDTLRDRYARGDLSEAEFERKVEALLETETPESARRRIEHDSAAETPSRDDRDAAFESDERAR